MATLHLNYVGIFHHKDGVYNYILASNSVYINSFKYWFLVPEMVGSALHL